MEERRLIFHPFNGIIQLPRISRQDKFTLSYIRDVIAKLGKQDTDFKDPSLSGRSPRKFGTDRTQMSIDPQVRNVTAMTH